jgi:hypothetical protein
VVLVAEAGASKRLGEKALILEGVAKHLFYVFYVFIEVHLFLR